jgi:putative NADH-flavin reductase
VDESSLSILVLGASGACGAWAVRIASDRGHDVTAVVRPESDYTPPDGVHVERGQVTDPEFLHPLLNKRRLVISCLGLRRRGKSPWARLLSPPDLVERVSASIIQGTNDPKSTRLIWVSAGGVGSSHSQLSLPVKRLIRSGNVRAAYQDLEAAERLLAEYGVCSLAVRPVTLIPGKPTGNAGPVRHYGMLSMIRRSDVAQWMVDVADGSKDYEDADILLG